MKKADTMSLYEVTNGWSGNSYTRCYVWAIDEREALGMAHDTFKSTTQAQGAKYPSTYWERLEARELFSANAKPFCTEVSDDGWDCGYVPA